MQTPNKARPALLGAFCAYFEVHFSYRSNMFSVGVLIYYLPNIKLQEINTFCQYEGCMI